LKDGVSNIAAAELKIHSAAAILLPTLQEPSAEPLFDVGTQLITIPIGRYLSEVSSMSA
jgi:hypothetical protein